MDSQLLNYILTELEKNISESDIKKALRKSGWKKDVINQGFETVYSTPALTNSDNLGESDGTGVGFTIKRIRPARKLLRDSIKLLFQYWQRFGVIIGISILPAFLITALVLLKEQDIISDLVLGIFFFILIIPSIIVGVWSIVAILMLIKNRRLDMSIMATIKAPFSKIIPYWWVMILISILTSGAYFLFFFPGILFSIWFLLGPIIVITEDEGGMDALLISREYTRNYKRSIIWRLLFIVIFQMCLLVALGLLGFVLAFFLLLFGDSTFLLSIIFMTIGPLLSSLYFIYLYLLYEDLVKVRGPVSYRATNGKKFLYFAVSIVGYIVGGILTIALVVMGFAAAFNSIGLDSLPSVPDTASVAQGQYSDITHLRSVLGIYHAQNQKYPTFLDELVPEFVEFLPIDPATDKEYEYSVENKGQNYTLCAIITDTKQCADETNDLKNDANATEN